MIERYCLKFGELVILLILIFIGIISGTIYDKYFYDDSKITLTEEQIEILEKESIK